MEKDSPSSRREVREPDRTVLFADTGAPVNTGDWLTPKYERVGEYSFVEANYWTDASYDSPAPWGDGVPDWKPGYEDLPAAVDLNRSVSPSLHFRHGGKVNVGWCDGRVTGEGPMFSRMLDVYGTEIDYWEFGLGWFGADDNTNFALDKKNLTFIPKE